MKHKQKLIAIIVITIPLLIACSCSKDNSYQNRIIGRWFVTNYMDCLYTGDGSQLYSISYGGNYSIGEVVEFTSSGKVLIDNTYKGTYTIHNETITLCDLDSEIEIYSIVDLTNSIFSITNEQRNVAYDPRDENNNYIGTFYDGIYITSYKFERVE